MDSSNLRHLLSLALLVSCCCLLLASQSQLVRAQTVETDEQFEAYHHDIGRINPSSPGSSHVSPASIVKQVVQQQPLADYNSPVVAPVTVPARQTQQSRSQSRLRSSQSATSGSSRLRTTNSAIVDDSLVPVRVPLAAAPVPVVVSPSSSSSSAAAVAASPSRYLDNLDSELMGSGNNAASYTNQYNQYNEQPALASFRASASSASTQQQPQYNRPVSSIQTTANRQQQQQQQQQVLASYQPSPPTPPTYTSTLPQQALTNNAAYLRSYPSSSIASSPVDALPPLPIASSAPTLYSQVEPVVAASMPQQVHNGLSGGPTNQVQDQIAAPSYEHVLSHGCPHHGVFSYPHADHCDRYYMCTNGTFTEEACPNGLSYGTQGAVYQHCAYRWNIDCGKKKAPGPISSPGCPWQFGVFPASGHQCSINYHECEWGVPEVKTCHPEGLFYDERIKGCQWADQLGCKSEALLNFKCPHEDEDNPYWPFPRYYHSKTDVIVCVNEQPRLVHCTDDQIVDPSSLACLDTKKKKKKF